MLSNLKENAAGSYPGFMDLELDSHLTSIERKDLFLLILDLTKMDLELKGDFISTDELNSFIKNEYTQGKFINPMQAKRVIKIIDFLIQLVIGKLIIKDSDPIDYSF